MEKYTEQRQKRREQRRKRQKRTGLGLTASRPLKSIPLTKGQGVKLAVVQPFSQREQIKPSFVSKRFPALCAIGLHLIAMLIATRYVVFQSQVIDDDQIMVEMFEAHQVQQRRRMRARTFKSIESPSTYPRNVLQSKPKITTTVEILRSESAFTVPQDAKSIGGIPTLDSKNIGTLGSAKRREVVVEGKPIQIASVIPQTGDHHMRQSSVCLSRMTHHLNYLTQTR